MSGQQEFDWTRADQLGLLERAVLPRGPGVSSLALKAVLKAIDGFGRGREAWPGYEALAISAGVSVRTCKRAVNQLVELSLLCVERRGRLTLNHYRIVWSELSCLLPERSAMRAERSATLTERSATLSPTKCHADTLNVQETYKETTTTEEVPEVVVVSSCGVARAKEAIARATQIGLSAADIAERVEAWKLLPDDRRRPGVLYNWLTRQGSYTPEVAALADEPMRSLRLAKLPNCVDENRRAELIRYGRAQGWTAATLQRAVERFEAQVFLVEGCNNENQFCANV